MLRTKVGGKKFNACVIRFRRKGRIFDPIYDICVMSQQSRNRGAYIEKLGYYNPRFSERNFFFNGQRFAYWLNGGAVVHPTVKKYLAKMCV